MALIPTPTLTTNSNVHTKTDLFKQTHTTHKEHISQSTPSTNHLQRQQEKLTISVFCWPKRQWLPWHQPLNMFWSAGTGPGSSDTAAVETENHNEPSQTENHHEPSQTAEFIKHNHALITDQHVYKTSHLHSTVTSFLLKSLHEWSLIIKCIPSCQPKT